MLNEINHLPEGLLTAKAEDLHRFLETPTLFHLKGSNPQPLFICTLLHGNETTGLYALQRLLKKYRDKPLPRALSVFIGNIAAAKNQQRHLDNQQDYNRIWPGSHFSDSPEKDMMQTVTNIMRRKNPFASIDVHNNTGKNPHYACINILNPHCLELAAKFSDIAVYFTSPKGVQSSSFADFCPSIVLECGQSGDQSGETHALHFLQSILTLDKFSSPGNKLKLFHTIARVLIPKTVTLADALDNQRCDIYLNPALEDKNFCHIEPGTVFATVNSDKETLVMVNNESNEDISDEYLTLKNRQLVFKKPVTLSMYTTNEQAIRQDCACYFMEELRIG